MSIPERSGTPQAREAARAAGRPGVGGTGSAAVQGVHINDVHVAALHLRRAAHNSTLPAADAPVSIRGILKTIFACCIACWVFCACCLACWVLFACCLACWVLFAYCLACHRLYATRKTSEHSHHVIYMYVPPILTSPDAPCDPKESQPPTRFVRPLCIFFCI